MTAPSEPALPLIEAGLPAELAARAAPYPLAFDARDPVGWQARIRAAWAGAVPPAPPAQAVSPLVPAGFQRLALRFGSGALAEGALLLPAGPGPHPAVLLLHDHGGEFRIGWRKMVAAPETDALSALAAAGADRFYGGGFLGQRLQRAGFAVLALDAFGWGARQACDHAGQQALAAAALQLGTSLAAITAAEDRAAAEWLAAQPFVQGVTAMGFSFGGFRAWQVSALSPAVQAAAALSWMARRRDLLVPGNPLLNGQSAFWMLHPGLTGVADLPDLAGAAAPKPLFLRTGDADRHLPAAAVAGAHEDLSVIWAAFGGRLDAGLFAGEHVCPAAVQDAAAAFLASAIREGG